MQLSRKRLLRGAGIVVVISILLPYLISGCFSFRMNQKSVVEYYKNQDIQPVLRKVNYKTWDIHFAEIGADTLPLVVFVHGAPGSWSAFRHFLRDSTLYSKAHLISVDRPGYGYSDFGRPATKLEDQSRLLSVVFEYNKSGKPAILVGHSLGGPIIARMAIDYPEQVGGVIMVAPSIDPELEPEEWYRLPLSLPMIRWVLPISLDMTNREILHLRSELEKMLPLWKEILAPTIIIQGGKDELVAPGNAQFAEKMIINAPVQVQFKPDVDHFIPWNNPGLIKEAIFSSLPYLEKD